MARIMPDLTCQEGLGGALGAQPSGLAEQAATFQFSSLYISDSESMVFALCDSG